MNPGAAAGRSVAFATLGCKLNQFETDSIATRFRRAGYRIVEFTDPADVYVVNSCTVTNRADRKSRNLLNRADRLRAAGSADASDRGIRRPLVVLTGCYVESHRDALEGDESTWFVGNERKSAIPELVEAHFAGEMIHPAGSVFDFPVPDRIFHTRSIVKVQDGCDNRCSFCIIPHVRGRAVSRPADQVVDSLRDAVDAGAREIVLTGVNMSRYRDGAADFTALVERVLAVEGDWRLRISSLEPDGLSERFLDLFAHPRMAPHLHLCLQSGSDRVLLAMRRQYTYDEYRSLAAGLRSRDPLFNLTTDIIVGFPSESNHEFEQTHDAVGDNRFGHVHTFPYSVREGTRAQRMDGHIDEREKALRAARVRTAATASKRAYRARLVGTTERVLVETASISDEGTHLHGLGEHYVPVEVTVPSVAAASPADHENRFVDVTIRSLGDGDDPPLFGTLA